MAKAVFTARVEPTCDDLTEFRYHFPRSYLRQAEATAGGIISAGRVKAVVIPMR